MPSVLQETRKSNDAAVSLQAQGLVLLCCKGVAQGVKGNVLLSFIVHAPLVSSSSSDSSS